GVPIFTTTLVDGENLTCAESITFEYEPESEKNASSAVTRLRRSETIAVLYALFFVFANFGIAIAAKMPMITTTMRSSMRVKPLRSFNMFRYPGKKECWATAPTVGSTASEKATR